MAPVSPVFRLLNTNTSRIPNDSCPVREVRMVIHWIQPAIPMDETNDSIPITTLGHDLSKNWSLCHPGAVSANNQNNYALEDMDGCTSERRERSALISKFLLCGVSMYRHNNTSWSGSEHYPRAHQVPLHNIRFVLKSNLVFPLRHPTTQNNWKRFWTKGPPSTA